MARVRRVISASISCRIGHEAVLGPAGIVHGAAAIEIHRRRPQRIVRARHQHLIAVVEQRAQHQVDQLADAVADEYLLGAHPGHAARLLLHDHGFARREDALLVAVALAFGQVLDHRQPHGLGRAKTEQPRIADVQRDDLVALPLQLVRAARKPPADLVADVLERIARSNGVIQAHGRSLTRLAGGRMMQVYAAVTPERDGYGMQRS